MSVPQLIPLMNYLGCEVYYPLHSLKSLEIYQMKTGKFKIRAIVFDDNPVYKNTGERLLLIHPPAQEMTREEARRLLNCYVQEYTTDMSHDLMIKIDDLEAKIDQLNTLVSENRKRTRSEIGDGVDENDRRDDDKDDNGGKKPRIN